MTISNVVVFKGDKIRVLMKNEDVVLIEIVGKEDNPYAVPAARLASVSIYND